MEALQHGGGDQNPSVIWLKNLMGFWVCNGKKQLYKSSHVVTTMIILHTLYILKNTAIFFFCGE